MPFISMTWLLIADEAELFHQLCCPPAAQFYVFGGDHQAILRAPAELLLSRFIAVAAAATV